MVREPQREHEGHEGRVGLAGGHEHRATGHVQIGKSVHGKVAVDDAVVGPVGHPGGAYLVEPTADAAPDRLGRVVVQVLQSTATAAPEEVVPCLVSAHDVVDVVGTEPQVDT
jgi:hypothetical protein